ncbi:MAG: hypothetical protein VX017_10530, partial [Pseudomonadota bacterium]|nr:hypothetical protein [Pseudomonadota bacterium]
AVENVRRLIDMVACTTVMGGSHGNDKYYDDETQNRVKNSKDGAMRLEDVGTPAGNADGAAMGRTRAGGRAVSEEGLRAGLAEEANCSTSDIQWMFEMAFRNGSTDNVARFRSWMPFGVYHSPDLWDLDDPWSARQAAEEEAQAIPLEVGRLVAKLELDERRPLHDRAVQADAVRVELEVARVALVAKRDEQKRQERRRDD